MHELEPEPPSVLCSQVGGAEHPPEREALLSQRVVRGQHALDALTPVLAAALFPPYVRLKISRDARIKNVGKYESCMADPIPRNRAISNRLTYGSDLYFKSAQVHG